MKRWIALWLVAMAVAGGCTAKAPLEDEAGWNCHTQGNHVCGLTENGK